MKPEFEDLNLVEIATKYGDDEKARVLLESIRWPNGPVCPHCKCTRAYKITGKATSKRPARKGVYKCAECRRQYTVTVKTVFEDSHIPLGKWLMAVFIICSSKKAISSHQLHRMLKVTYKTAWFMTHRIRYAMNEGPLGELMKGIVECDETYVGGKAPMHSFKNGVHKTAYSNKTPVFSLVQRDGKKRSIVMPFVTAKNLREAINQHVCPTAHVMTDESNCYLHVKETRKHSSVCHKIKQYAKKEGDVTVHTNTVESSFSLLKRGVFGAFHHVSGGHLHRYVAEFDFRWNYRKVSDGERTAFALAGIEGKRLKYRESSN